LAGVHRLSHIDTCLGKPLEMVFAQLGVNEMEGFIPPSKPSLKNERSTLCSSSALLKKAQM